MKKLFQSKRLGQVFLKDRNILDKILASAKLQPTDVVVEIGCGEGWLSAALAKTCATLYIFEIDPRFLAITKDRLSAYSHVVYCEGDVIKNTFLPISSPLFKVVANIPYQISAPITKLLINATTQLSVAVVMVQKEFAQKLIALPNTRLYTSFSLYCQYHLQIRLLFHVSKTCFRPIPKVDSSVIEIIPRTSKPLPVEEEDVFFSMVRSAFWARRKTLFNCLKHSPYLTLDPLFGQDTDMAPFLTRRGETLGLSEFLCLYHILKKYRLHLNIS